MLSLKTLESVHQTFGVVGSAIEFVIDRKRLALRLWEKFKAEL